MTKEVQKWADSAMFQSEPLKTTTGPSVTLLSAPNDPLGAIAACAKMYLGEVVRDLSDITDAERRHYLGEMKKTKLKMPLESVSMHFMLEGVSRGFTHQLVRQRTGAYAQESMRFAVIEDEFADRVVLPPSLAGSDPNAVQEAQEAWKRTYRDSDGKLEWTTDDNDPKYRALMDAMARVDKRDKWRREWDNALGVLERAYKHLVDDGMPAEDARGLLPTNIATRVNYITNFRGLLDHAGNRLCTQAQFEWRLVLAKLADSLRVYGRTQTYKRIVTEEEDPNDILRQIDQNRGERELKLYGSSEWQYNALADLLRPVCYQVGSCVMKADFDRKCSIRDRVDAFSAEGVSSKDWNKQWVHPESGTRESWPEGAVIAIDPIRPSEWLADPGAAR